MVDFFVGDPFFAEERPGYLLISERVLPALLEAGIIQGQIDQMMFANPRRFSFNGRGDALREAAAVEPLVTAD